MKYVLLALATLLPAAAMAQETPAISYEYTYRGQPEPKTPSVNAPGSLSGYSQDLCQVTVSGGINTGAISFGGGRTVTDQNCERMKLSKLLYDYGMKVASVTLLCQDPRVFASMEQAGTPCPFEGKIGGEAEEAWQNYDFERPDYGHYVAKLDKRKAEGYPEKDAIYGDGYRQGAQVEREALRNEIKALKEVVEKLTEK